MGEERLWVKKGYGVTRGSLRATLRPRGWLMRPGASDEGHVRVRRASQGSMVKGGRRDEQWLREVGASSFGFVRK